MRLLLTDPLEFVDRADVAFHGRLESSLAGAHPRIAYGEGVSFEEAIRTLARVLGRDVFGIINELEFHEMHTHIKIATAELAAWAALPFPIFYNADSTLTQLGYLLCRVLEPETVVETGVGYGALSAVVLAALRKNRKGTLHSIDLPPIGDRASRAHIGILVPAAYRQGWHLHQGSSKRILPRLLATSNPKIDIFIHDSANVDKIQRVELATAWRHMSPRAALIVNSVQGKMAFWDFVEREHVRCWLAVEQREKKGHLTGVVLQLPRAVPDALRRGTRSPIRR
jgi:predicted O-methyltransferase YrrM